MQCCKGSFEARCAALAGTNGIPYGLLALVLQAGGVKKDTPFSLFLLHLELFLP